MKHLFPLLALLCLQLQLSTSTSRAQSTGDFLFTKKTASGPNTPVWLTPSSTNFIAFNGSGSLTTVSRSDYLTTAAAISTYQPLDADLTTIAGLADPNADRLLFWDDSAGAYAYLTAGSGLTISGTTISASGGGGSGDVVGPASSTDNAIARFDGTDGKLLQNSGPTISDGGVLSSSAGITVGGATLGSSPFASLGGNEILLVNNRTTGFIADATQYNVLALQSTYSGGVSAMRFLNDSGLETGAMGYGNSSALPGYLDGCVYIAGSNHYNSSGVPQRDAPAPIMIGQEGVISGVQTNRRRMVFGADWAIHMYDISGTSRLSISPDTSGVVNVNGVLFDRSSSANAAMRTVGLEQIFQCWQDATPSAAWSVGCGAIGAGAGGDYVVNMYNGSAWSEKMRLSNAGVLTLPGSASITGQVSSLYSRIGSGSPEGAVSAPVGAVYHRTDGSAGSSFYVKESGSGNTGWIAK